MRLLNKTLFTNDPLSTIFSRNTDPSISDRFRSVFNKRRNKRLGPTSPASKPGVVDENKPDIKSLASSAAKFVLRGVKESADACPQFKSVVGCFCFILDNYEVQSAPYITQSKTLTVARKQLHVTKR